MKDALIIVHFHGNLTCYSRAVHCQHHLTPFHLLLLILQSSPPSCPLPSVVLPFVLLPIAGLVIKGTVLYTTQLRLDRTAARDTGTSFLILMSGVSQLPSKMPHLHPLSSMPNFSVSSVSTDPVTTLLPQEETAIQAYTVVIVVIFCAVCLLLLLAFLYTFCFHCSIQTPPKDQRSNGFSLDREDATYKGSSSECPSVANVV